jgi:hypothetical protein
VHGLGFADALQELDLSGWSLVRALFGFNIGVEIGQAMVVLIAIPVLFYISSLRHARLAYRVMSLGVAGAGAVWFVQRVFLT